MPPASRPPAAREKYVRYHALPIPRATYRLQFHKGFTFAQAAALVPYLAALGVSHVYASPCLKARDTETIKQQLAELCSRSSER
jgi:(1->4)-alpha-D-glucan 1-alpha-D-glucosylmutase